MGTFHHLLEEQLRAIHNQKWRELSGYLCFLLAVSWESISSFSCLPLAWFGIAECAASCLRLCISLEDMSKGFPMGVAVT